MRSRKADYKTINDRHTWVVVAEDGVCNACSTKRAVEGTISRLLAKQEEVDFLRIESRRGMTGAYPG